MRAKPAGPSSLVALSIAAAILGRVVVPASAAVPPLTPEQRTRLATARDGRDHQEEAFVALVENAGRFTPGLGDAPVRLAPDLDAMREAPDAFRGDLCRITGVLQQREALGFPHEGIDAWFVRDDAGAVALVHVVPAGEAADGPAGFRPGTRIEILARFYKRTDAMARDGRPRGYATFVGARPRVIGAAGGTGAPAGVVVAVVVMGAFFLVLLWIARTPAARSRRARAREPMTDDGPASEVDAEASLPEDPADALAALKRRAP